MPSEDPLVCAAYGGAYVAAFQGRNQAATPLKAAATAKHWAFYDLEVRQFIFAGDQKIISHNSRQE